MEYIVTGPTTGYFVDLGVVNPDTTKQNSPYITVNPADSISQTPYVVTQQRNVAGATDASLFARRRNAAGWEAPMQVPTTPGTFADLNSSSLAWYNNEWYIAWYEMNGGSSDVKVAKWDGVTGHAIVPVGSTPTVNALAIFSTAPSVSFNSRGVLYVSYTEGVNQLVLKHLDGAGNWVTDSPYFAQNAGGQINWMGMTMVGEMQYRVLTESTNGGTSDADPSSLVVQRLE
jgi:hypothetical protein